MWWQLRIRKIEKMHWKYSDYVVGTTEDITRQRITLCFATSNPSIQDCFVRVPITECTALLMWHLHVRVEARRQLPVSFSGSHSPYFFVFIWEMGCRACWEVIVKALKEVEMGCRACWEVIITALREVEMGHRACWGFILTPLREVERPSPSTGFVL